MTATPIERQPLLEAIKTRLEQQVPQSSDVHISQATGVAMSEDGKHAKPYHVLHLSPGTPSTEADLADRGIDLDITIQITCAAGWAKDAEQLIEDTWNALHRWRPVVTFADRPWQCGPLKPPAGYDPGPLRWDKDVQPHRPFLPLQFRTRITTT